MLIIIYAQESIKEFEFKNYNSFDSVLNILIYLML